MEGLRHDHSRTRVHSNMYTPHTNTVLPFKWLCSVTGMTTCKHSAALELALQRHSHDTEHSHTISPSFNTYTNECLVRFACAQKEMHAIQTHTPTNVLLTRIACSHKEMHCFLDQVQHHDTLHCFLDQVQHHDTLHRFLDQIQHHDSTIPALATYAANVCCLKVHVSL